MQKTITRHVWEGAKEKTNALRLTKWGKKVYARFRGLLKVQMQCLLVATAQNMKKMAQLVVQSVERIIREVQGTFRVAEPRHGVITEK